jgi:hypothetical protein
MYIVKRNGKVLFGSRKFPTYDKARNKVRAYIRELVKKGKLKYDWGFFDEVSPNPTNITGCGFKIQRS